MAKELWSIFTNDMNTCMFTESPMVERHHVYSQQGGHVRDLCEKYGFIAPLRADLHPNGVHATEEAKEIDYYLKTECQKYYEEHYGTREDFIKEFRKSYL